MTSPPLPAITLNACLLVGCAAVLVLRGASHAGEVVANPTGGGGTVQLEPVPERAKPSRTRAVFVCRDHAPVIFSDRPCGPNVQELVVHAPPPPAGRAASTVPKPAPATTLPKAKVEPGKAPVRTDGDRCRRMREQLEKLDDRMRTGYSAREAARLWNRWRDLKSEIYAERC